MNTVTLTLNNEELQAIVGLVDAGVKAIGLSSVKVAASVLAKFEAAVAEANAKNDEQKEAA